MKKLLLFTFVLAFSASLTAQAIPKTTDLQKSGMDAVSASNPETQAQIKEALMKDDGLQKQTIDYLKSNPETTKSLANMATKSKGSNSSLMNAILGDQDLATAAINYISSNPELLSKAMKVIGM